MDDSSALRAWIREHRLSDKVRDDVLAAADTLDDLREADRADLEQTFADLKPLPRMRLFKLIDALKGGAAAAPAAPEVEATESTPKRAKKPRAEASKKPRTEASKPRAPPAAAPSSSSEQRKREASKPRAPPAAAPSSSSEQRKREATARVHGSLKYDPGAKLVFLRDNPKAKLTSENGVKAAARYASYSACGTVGEFYRNGGTTGDLIYDLTMGYCAVGDDGGDAPDAGPDWAARFDEVVWVQQHGLNPWPGMIMDPDEAAEPTRTKAKRAAGVEYLVWNFQVEESEIFSFAPPVYITSWAEGFEKDFHRRAWTGKYAESFPAALEEADAVFRRNDAA